MKDVYRIGILAGMGPRSTAPFLESVLNQCEKQYGAKFDEDFPHMMIYSLPTPFHPHKPLEHEKMVDALKIGIDTLTNASCNIIAIPCNVVHIYYDQMIGFTAVPILNIINETMSHLEPYTTNVSLLATRAIAESRLYQDQLEMKNKLIFWSDELQSKVDELILKIKIRGVSEETLRLWQDIESMIRNEGVTEVVCACTDLTFYGHESTLKFYDSSEILAASLVHKYINETRVIHNEQ